MKKIQIERDMQIKKKGYLKIVLDLQEVFEIEDFLFKSKKEESDKVYHSDDFCSTGMGFHPLENEDEKGVSEFLQKSEKRIHEEEQRENIKKKKSIFKFFTKKDEGKSN